jgi:hypothetical protein
VFSVIAHAHIHLPVAGTGIVVHAAWTGAAARRAFVRGRRAETAFSFVRF